MDIMLSRGVDPNVLDPSQCHTHPEVPDEWPSQEEMQRYVVQGVRAELLTAAATAGDEAAAMQALCLALEHERMHLETLCYMIAQQRKKDFVAAAKGEPVIQDEGALVQRQSGDGSTNAAPFYLHRCSYLAAALKCGKNGGSPQFVRVAAGSVHFGLDPSEPHGFAWDNEVGLCGPLEVAEFDIAAWPVTVAQFMAFATQDKGYNNPALWSAEDFALLAASGHAMPATWSADSSGQITVHLPEGSYPWQEVADCPVYVSLMEAQAFCRLHSGRVVTEAEYHHVLNLQSAKGSSAGAVRQLEDGGWEWTSSVFAPFEGFQPQRGYPEYSQDFFDGAHFVLKGCCPYTHPSLRRRSFRNFYQAQYPNVLAKFRMARAPVPEASE